jgi:single-stranded-DNA-specific exonuclease
LVAGKLVEEYGRPAIVISRGAQFSKGSARSVNGFNILEALRANSALLEEVGGHEAAAGFTVLNRNLDRFVKEIKKRTEEELKGTDPRPVLKIDTEFPLQSVNYQLLEELEKFAPHGVGNPEIVFASRGVNVLEERRVGRGKKHLKLLVSPGFEAIWFNHGGEKGFTLGEEVSIAYTPQIDRWGGKDRVTLKIRDLKRGDWEA